MVVVWSLLAIVLSLLIVVGLHEAGHAYTARLFNVNVTRISIGFGKPLFRWKGKNGCEWVWALWPLGGYVRLLNTRIQPVSKKDLPHCFDKQSVGARCLILLAGPAVNLLIAWLALLLLLMLGYSQRVPVIDAIAPSSVAAKAGLAAGDKIVSLAGLQMPSWRSVGLQLIMTMGHDDIDVVVENTKGKQRHLSLDLKQGLTQSRPVTLFKAIGIHPNVSIQSLQQVQGIPFFQALNQAFFQLMNLGLFFLVLLKQLLTGAIPFSFLLGPLGLFTVIIDSFLQGLTVFLYFMANLSLSVALMNLFPIPGLDGGSIVYALIEKIRGKAVSVGTEVLVHRLVFIAFCLLLVQLMLNDAERHLY